MHRLACTPEVTRALFVRGVGLVYAVAFVSVWRQAHGLIGPEGILPAGEYLASAARVLGSAEAVWRLPTWLWLGAGDPALHLLCAGGTVAALLAVVGVAPAVTLAAAWSCYLSVVSAGQIFFAYQWDILLLETGVVAWLWTPWTLRPTLLWPGAASRAAVWLARWLLFRLMWSSGVAKLLSGDPTWRDLTAMTYHYESQPLPAWTSRWFHELPEWYHRLEVVGTLGIEVLVPFAIFAPPRWRRVAAVAFVALHGLISLSGNYGFFNLLGVILCLPLLQEGSSASALPARAAPRRLVHGLAALLFLLGGTRLLDTLGLPGGGWLQPLQRLVAPLHLTSHYGLFASMTTSRPEIVVEGSRDGDRWEAYEFRWKPTDPDRAPAFAPGHMPRLDWQMWFAALRGYDRAPWFRAFAAALLQGRVPVIDLLARDPFDGDPPAYLRARLVDYRFAPSTGDGAWWNRGPQRTYTPVLSLRR
jgi:hypothetical protein